MLWVLALDELEPGVAVSTTGAGGAPVPGLVAFGSDKSVNFTGNADEFAPPVIAEAFALSASTSIVFGVIVEEMLFPVVILVSSIKVKFLPSLLK